MIWKVYYLFKYQFTHLYGINVFAKNMEMRTRHTEVQITVSKIIAKRSSYLKKHTSPGRNISYPGGHSAKGTKSVKHLE